MRALRVEKRSCRWRVVVEVVRLEERAGGGRLTGEGLFLGRYGWMDWVY